MYGNIVCGQCAYCKIGVSYNVVLKLQTTIKIRYHVNRLFLHASVLLLHMDTCHHRFRPHNYVALNYISLPHCCLKTTL